MASNSWQPPTPASEPPKLMVYNSLTRSKVEFVTTRPGIVSWYNCGPTVYDASHMGHARNYLTQDIMRRILRDYFGYEVQFVMNITDVDDKIIVRGRQRYLLNQYLASSEEGTDEQRTHNIKSAWEAYLAASSLGKALPEEVATDPAKAWAFITSSSPESQAWRTARQAADEKYSLHLNALTASAGFAGLEGGKDTKAANDLLAPWLDAQHGSSITDPSIFRELAGYWEADFQRCMALLRVERPTTLTRVSEYIPEIVSFVEGIVGRGYAYEGKGSVWFDTAKFEGASTSEKGADWAHTYAKLQPWSKGNRELLEDGEGSLSSGMGKKSASDFALWKTSKPGEPAWDSPWGPGRPGWHIECSVMASAVLGKGMDVHSGGVDLAFPHHDNEIAQSEAFHDCRQWVNYFLHTGHLHIEGLKMSKSLKNFITIDEALSKNSARQMRLAFLATNWSSKLDFKESSMEEIRSSEKSLDNFFTNVKAIAREAEARESESDGTHHYGEQEHALTSRLLDTQATFRAAMCDSFDTPRAMQSILDLVSASNVYLAKGRSAVNVGVLRAVEEWVTRMLRMLGLGEGSERDSKGQKVIGWGAAVAEGEGAGAQDREETVMPFLSALSTFRDAVRGAALEENPSLKQVILRLCDEFRDGSMADLGVALDDQDDGKALVKLVDPAVLKAAREEKLAAAEKKKAAKVAQAALAEAKRKEKLEKGKVDPATMFDGIDEYGEKDEAGVPLKDKEGVELSKGKRKKLLKDWETQKKLHDEYLASL